MTNQGERETLRPGLPRLLTEDPDRFNDLFGLSPAKDGATIGQSAYRRFPRIPRWTVAG